MNSDIIQTVQDKIHHNFHFQDTLVIPENLQVETGVSYNIYYQGDLEDTEVLYIFNHSGLEVPEQFSNFLIADQEELANTIYLNHDIGTRYLASELLDKLSKGLNDYDYAVVIFNYSRVVIDSNRLQIAEQLVNTPYRGESIWAKTEGREVISQELISPFFHKVTELAQLPKLKLVFYPHSMDEYGGGKASGGHEIAGNGDRRPPTMIFREYKFDSYPYGDYGEDRQVDFDLVSREQVISIQEVHNQHLEKISQGTGEEAYTEVDYPYVSPRQLCGLVSKYFAGPQLVLDVRKDLFGKGGDELAASTDKISQATINK